MSLLILLAPAGCALFGPSPPAQPETVLSDYGQLAARIHAAAWQADSWSGLCEMEYGRNGESQSADAVTLVAQPDRLYLELTGPMGITLGAMALSGGRLAVNNLHEGWRWEGEASPGRLSRFALPAGSDTRLVGALTGGPLPPEHLDSSMTWRYDAHDTHYRISRDTGAERQEWEIDPFNFTVLRQVSEKEGMASTVNYAGYRANGLRLVPTVMRLEARGVSLSLDCPEINHDVPLNDSDFVLPPAPGLRLRDDDALSTAPE